MRITKNKCTQFVLVIAVFGIVTFAWQFIATATQTPEYLLPRPLSIAKRFIAFLKDPTFWKDTTITLSEILLGFVLSILVAIIIGALISQIMVLELSLLPYIVAFQTIPSITLAPIFVNWFGYGMASKIVMVFTVAAFPIIMMVIAGLQSSSSEQIQMLRSFGANRLQILKKVQVPNALPFFFTGLRLGIIMSVTGAIVAEFQGAEAGLGYRIAQYYQNAKVIDAFAAIFALSIIGVLLYSLIGLLRSYVVFWISPHNKMF